jgi:hypothetical protein
LRGRARHETSASESSNEALCSIDPTITHEGGRASHADPIFLLGTKRASAK